VAFRSLAWKSPTPGRRQAVGTEQLAATTATRRFLTLDGLTNGMVMPVIVFVFIFYFILLNGRAGEER
jgi:hypothetical protein